MGDFTITQSRLYSFDFRVCGYYQLFLNSATVFIYLPNRIWKSKCDQTYLLPKSTSIYFFYFPFLVYREPIDSFWFYYIPYHLVHQTQGPASIACFCFWRSSQSLRLFVATENKDHQDAKAQHGELEKIHRSSPLGGKFLRLLLYLKSSIYWRSNCVVQGCTFPRCKKEDWWHNAASSPAAVFSLHPLQTQQGALERQLRKNNRLR